MDIYLRTFAGSLCFFTALCVSAVAADAPTKIDQKTEEVARKMTAQFEAAKSAEADLKVTVELTGPEKKEAPTSYSLTVVKPNKLALVLKEGVVGASVYSDGTNATTFIPMMNRYMVEPASKHLAELVLNAGSAFGDSTGSMAFIAALFSDNPYTALVAGVKEASYGGIEIIAGTPLQRLNFTQEGVTWSLLITTNAAPQLRRIEVDVSKLPVDANKMTMEFSNWKFDPTIAPDRFQFVPPKDAQKVDAFFEGDSDMIGDKLPEFKLHSIDGAKWDSTAWKGQPSVLVFWAGQEDHCVNALKTLTELAGANKGVKFYAINVDEQSDKNKVKALYSKNKITLPTALDPSHNAADELEVDGVPMTFLIDKEGVIRNAFLGYHAEFKDVVGKEIKALTGDRK